MKKALVLVSLVILLGGLCGRPAWAAEPAVLNAPPVAYSKAKAVIDVLSPGYDALYDFHSGQWYQGASAALWNFDSENIHLASVRLGYYTDAKIAGGVQLNLPGLTQRYVPSSIKGIATQGYLDLFWKLAGKYGTVGLMSGYDFDHQDKHRVLVGLTLGGHVSF